MEVPCTTKLSFLAQCCFQENNSFYSKLSSFYLPKMAILYFSGIFHHITYTLYFESLNTKFDIFLFFFHILYKSNLRWIYELQNKNRCTEIKGHLILCYCSCTCYFSAFAFVHTFYTGCNNRGSNWSINP